VGALGCGGGAVSGADDSCASNDDCEAGYACIGGDCAEVCSDDSHCTNPGERCIDGVCSVDTAAECTAATVAEDCTSPEPCELLEGVSCVSGSCVYPDEPCDEPREAECINNDSTYRAYASPGTCEQSSGDCSYSPVDTDCPNCAVDCLGVCDGITCDELHGGCRDSGTCVPTEPPSCQYTNADDRAACTLPEGGDGLCLAGDCVECIEAADCDDDNPCTEDACSPENVCSNTAIVDEVVSCDDGNACTQTDECDNGQCVGRDEVVCVQDACREAAVCDPLTGVCSTGAPLGAGFNCDDGAFCNGADTCDGAGSCLHAGDPCPGPDGDNNCAESCNEAIDSCNENDPVDSACNDGIFCNGDDTCNSVGACVQHAGDPCLANVGDGDNDCSEACNEDTDDCTANDPSSSSCDDGQLCTYSDVCNGSGTCGGTPITCNDDGTTCGATRECNGTSTCTVAYTPANIICDDGDFCTSSSACDGAGHCAPVSRLPSGWHRKVTMEYTQNDPDGNWATEQEVDWSSDSSLRGIRISGTSDNGGYCYAYWGTGHVFLFRDNATHKGIYNVNGVLYDGTIGNVCPTSPPAVSDDGRLEICQTSTVNDGNLTYGTPSATGMNMSVGDVIHVRGRHTIGSGSDYIRCYVDINCQ
jgi:hypothetical protein